MALFGGVGTCVICMEGGACGGVGMGMGQSGR